MRKKALKVWTDEKIIEDLSLRSESEETTWFIFQGVELYGHKGPDGVDYGCADDDELRNIAILDFLRRNGGLYVCKPKKQ